MVFMYVVCMFISSFMCAADATGEMFGDFVVVQAPSLLEEEAKEVDERDATGAEAVVFSGSGVSGAGCGGGTVIDFVQRKKNPVIARLRLQGRLKTSQIKVKCLSLEEELAGDSQDIALREYLRFFDVMQKRFLHNQKRCDVRSIGREHIRHFHNVDSLATVFSMIDIYSQRVDWAKYGDIRALMVAQVEDLEGAMRRQIDIARDECAVRGYYQQRSIMKRNLCNGLNALEADIFHNGVLPKHTAEYHRLKKMFQENEEYIGPFGKKAIGKIIDGLKLQLWKDQIKKPMIEDYFK